MTQRVARKNGWAFVITFVVMLLAAAHSVDAQETSDSSGGYIDDALVRSRIRFRFDAGFDMNRPDRAEFFYASWAELTDHQHAIKNTNQTVNAPHNRGPVIAPQFVNYQDISTYLELNCNERMSVFCELPFRLVQFHGNLDEENSHLDTGESDAFDAAEDAASRKNLGVSDTQLGFKFAMVNDPNQFLTFQLRTFIPTGDARLGLGTGHFSIENGLLLQQRLSQDFAFMGQAKLWSPISGGSNAGNIAIYGAGLSYDAYHHEGFRISPVAEFVGWTVLNGFETIASPTGANVVPNGASLESDHGVQSAAGDTIVNAKLGFRTFLGSGSDVYVGWGHCLTGNRWYQDMLRIEYRRTF